MALRGSCPCCSPCRNLPSIDPIEDEFARDSGPARDPHSGNTFPALCHNPILGSALVPALISTLVLTPAPTLLSSNKLFK